MDVLVLGGTHHVGRALVEESLARGDSVTTVNRGLTGRDDPGAASLRADRTQPGELEAALGDRAFDLVVDTWSRAPSVVLEAAQLLADRVTTFAYVSSRSVYTWPMPVGLDESGPLVDGDSSSADGSDYAASKRGGELAVVETFGERALVARPGLILGPYELVGRLPWWLRRLERGGQVLAPRPADRALQYIDARDLACFLLDVAEQGTTGVFDTVSVPGHATWGELLECARTLTGGGAELVWVPPEVVAEAGIEPWTELPIWVPPEGELAGLHGGDVTKAVSRGLTCRPVAATIADTWAWLQEEGDPPSLSDGAIGLEPAKEAAALELFAKL
jgi:2'-hydroxyisoflavone reductase